MTTVYHFPATSPVHPELAAPPAGALRVLCLGDVVGSAGRQVVKERLPHLQKKYALDFIIANGENAAGGVGLTPETLKELLQAGVHMITSGNHIWKHREIHSHLDKRQDVLRPENYGSAAPGRGYAVATLPCGTRLGVLNLLGRVYMAPVECPFHAADKAVAALYDEGAQIMIVDFHAEATSEKRAMAHHLNGRVSAVLGTHTHVQTADAFISEHGTASLTDIGMCGVEEASILGVAKAPVLSRFITGLPHAFKPSKGVASLNGVLLDIEKASGKTLSLTLLRDKPKLLIDGQAYSVAARFFD